MSLQRAGDDALAEFTFVVNPNNAAPMAIVVEVLISPSGNNFFNFFIMVFQIF